MFLLELIVPPSPAQLDAVDGDATRYETELRPALMRRAIAELQDAGIEADVWKIEGIDRRDDCEMVAEQARAGGRDRVGCVVLGQGAEAGAGRALAPRRRERARLPRLRDRPDDLVGRDHRLPRRAPRATGADRGRTADRGRPTCAADRRSYHRRRASAP